MLQSCSLLAIVLLAPALAGCIGDDESADPAGLPGGTGIRLDELPAGAALERIENGLRVLWTDVPLPFEEDLTIPAGATMVRATVTLGGNAVPFVQMVNADTGRRRCQVPYVQTWNLATLGEMTCAGLTAVDLLPAKWTVRADGSVALADLVTVELLNVPLDGLPARLDLSKLSMPTHELLPTESVWIQSHDDARLYAEVTLPAGDGPWPVVLASSPYTQADHTAGRPAMWEYWVQDFAKRGYAAVMADVRGYGHSGGCVEVWGPNEQADQVALVEWAASQPWSNGNVGFYGQSYVGTTPVEAAINAPDALKAIIAVAPVINAYDDWHFGGVPNGENALSPVSYQQIGTDASLDLLDPLGSAMRAANGLCDPTLAARANDPRAIYDEFYDERNFSKAAGDVRAAVLYTQGFEDSNVKSAMITHWFNALDAPKLGLFGHWIHQHAVRADQEVLFLAWLDQYVKGIDLGVDDLPPVDVITNVRTHRETDAWPPLDARDTALYPDLSTYTLGNEPKDGSASLVMDGTGIVAGQGLEQLPTVLRVETTFDRDVHAAGNLRLDLTATLQGAENAHVAAFLYDESADGRTLVTWGMANLAHRNGHDRYNPVQPGETVHMALPFLPTEHVFRAGHTLAVEVRAAQVQDWALVQPAGPSTLTLHGGEDGTSLRLPVLPEDADAPVPLTATPDGDTGA